MASSHSNLRHFMTHQESYTSETKDSTLVVEFTVSTLVFPDQLRSIEQEMSGPEDAVNPRAAVLDFTGVAHISSSVWGEIIRQNKLLRETGRVLRLCNLNDDLHGALKAMKLDEILSVSDTRENAMSDLNRQEP